VVRPGGPAIEIAPVGLRPVVRLRGRVIGVDEWNSRRVVQASSLKRDDRPEALSPEFIRRRPGGRHAALALEQASVFLPLPL